MQDSETGSTVVCLGPMHSIVPLPLTVLPSQALYSRHVNIASSLTSVSLHDSCPEHDPTASPDKANSTQASSSRQSTLPPVAVTLVQASADGSPPVPVEPQSSSASSWTVTSAQAFDAKAQVALTSSENVVPTQAFSA